MEVGWDLRDEGFRLDIESGSAFVAVQEEGGGRGGCRTWGRSGRAIVGPARFRSDVLVPAANTWSFFSGTA